MDSGQDFIGIAMWTDAVCFQLIAALCQSVVNKVTKGVADHAGNRSFTGTEGGATHQEDSGGTDALPAIRQPLNVTCMKAH
jgi:hypothetical protein